MTASLQTWIDFGPGFLFLTVIAAAAVAVHQHGKQRTRHARETLKHPVRTDGGMFTVHRDRDEVTARRLAQMQERAARSATVIPFPDRRVENVVPLYPRDSDGAA